MREDRRQIIWKGEIKNPGGETCEAAFWSPFPQALLTCTRAGVGSSVCVSGEGPQAFLQLPFSNVNTPAWEQDGISEPQLSWRGGAAPAPGVPR